MSAAATPTLHLPQVTLACVDTRDPDMALDAMRRSMAGIRFGAAVLFTDPSRLDAVPQDIAIVTAQVASVAEYSRFVLTGPLPHLHTSHLLLVQWDGFATRPQAWDDAFLDVDYIGAPWPGFPPGRSVGNGGFSLRSRRLLQALGAPGMSQRHPEDLAICHDNRQRLEAEFGIRFAPPGLAARFAYERAAPPGPTFGFHGLFNMHRELPPQDLDDLLRRLPDRMSAGLDAHDLCASLIAEGRLDSARLLLDKRVRLGMRDRRTLRLRWRLWRARRQAGSGKGARA